MAKHSSEKKKPEKPYPEFPLVANGNGQWSKQINKRVFYFGPWADPDGALDEYKKHVDSIHRTGMKGEYSDSPVTIEFICERFMAAKDSAMNSGELAPRSNARYLKTCEMLMLHFGKKKIAESITPEDFLALRTAMAKRWGAIALANEIQIVRSVFLYALKNEILSRPARFGTNFDKPPAKKQRAARREKGERLFTADQIRAALEFATVNMKAMILLGINGALGNTELALLPIDSLDLKNGWLNYARTKTEIDRRIPLWPETVKAIKKVIESRKPKPEDSHLLFVGRRGENYVAGHKGYRVHQEASRVFKAAKIEGRTFYDLRRTFQTIAEGSRDLPAVQSIMGHAAGSDDMSAIYRQNVDDERLKAVTDHVHRWLFFQGKRE